MDTRKHTHLHPPKDKRSFLRRIFSSKRPPPPSPLTALNQLATAPIRPNTGTSETPDNQSMVDDMSEPPIASSVPASEAPIVLGSPPGQQTYFSAETNDEQGPISGRLGCLPMGHGSPTILRGAHGFKMDNPTFVQQNKVIYKIDKPFSDTKFLEKFYKDIDNGGTVLLILDKRRVAGAEMDSSDRDPPPRCHPETRKELRETLRAWLTNDERRWNFIWLSGPAGAGKSAVAQTFAELCHELGYLGASFFFSRQKRDTVGGLTATIAYQLADQDAGYNNLVTRILARSPAILDKALHVQFQKLIVEPFAILTAQCAEMDTIRKPLVIIVDGLDECSDEDAQCQIIRLVGEYTRQSGPRSFPILWLLSSRPEWHIKRTFAQADPPFQCGRETITCDAAQDAKDVYRILKDGLQNIRNKASWSLSGEPTNVQWPPEAKLQRLAQKVGGLPVFASTVIRFIGDGTGTPDSQLEACLLFLETTGELAEVNPLGALDALYRQIMARVTQSILPTALRILAFYVLSPSFQVFLYGPGNQGLERVSEVACFLGIDKDSFYLSLQGLHSVIHVPPAELAYQEPLRFFHKSFSDFLQDPIRSKSFSLDLDQARYDLAVLSLRWNNYFLRSNCKLKDCTCSDSLVETLHWISDQHAVDYQSSQDRLKLFARANCWKFCGSVRDSERRQVSAELAKFDFCHLFSAFSSKNDDDYFWSLVEWLWEGQDDHEQGLVRLRPSSQLDQNLALLPRSVPLPLLDSLELDQVRGKVTPRFFSLHQCIPRPWLLDLVKVMIWIGTEERTVLVYGFPDDKEFEALRSSRYMEIYIFPCLKKLLKRLNPEFQYEILRSLYMQLFQAEHHHESHSSLMAILAAAVRELTGLTIDDKTLSDFVLTAQSCDHIIRDLLHYSKSQRSGTGNTTVATGFWPHWSTLSFDYTNFGGGGLPPVVVYRLSMPHYTLKYYTHKFQYLMESRADSASTGSHNAGGDERSSENDEDTTPEEGSNDESDTFFSLSGTEPEDDNTNSSESDAENVDSVDQGDSSSGDGDVEWSGGEDSRDDDTDSSESD